MRLAFMGTPLFSVPTLKSLIAAGHDVACVYSQPPRPSGRGHKLQNSPVHEAALQHGLMVRTPVSLRQPHEQSEFSNLHLDAAIVVAYGLLLPREILEAPRLGCYNLHASILPRWRGAAPIHRAIMAGDTETGAMVMKMDEGLDTGSILSEWRTSIDDTTTTGTLLELLANSGATLVTEALRKLETGHATLAPQPAQGITYAKKIQPTDQRIDWTKTAREVVRQIHGLSPAPGAWTMAGDTRLKLYKARLAQGSGTPGRIIRLPFTVACGKDAVEVLELQRAGKGVQSTDDFVRGHPLPEGFEFS